GVMGPTLGTHHLSDERAAGSQSGQHCTVAGRGLIRELVDNRTAAGHAERSDRASVGPQGAQPGARRTSSGRIAWKRWKMETPSSQGSGQGVRNRASKTKHSLNVILE